MIARLAVFLLLFPALAAAEQLSPERFDALTQGRSIHYALPDGTFYGAEQYMSNRRVRWMYSDGQTCIDGHWWAEGSSLCFLYENEDTHQCWIAEKRDGRLFARVAGEPPEKAIGSVEISEKPLDCIAPDLGV